MDDVPRTHKTIDSLTWKGLSGGKEIWRRLDQERNLYYGKIDWEDIEGIANSGKLIVSLHSHEQERNRMKGNSGVATGGDLQNFELEDFELEDYELEDFELEDFELEDFELEDFELEDFELEDFERL